ncbi:MAG TPA: leucyl/phenylalanyl-tRNA--protein transferase [Chitinophagales bacterium]|nr:leucyl/phenylalanyl-tRNA--protein transferase [Chitinophagales bacterium]
MPIFRLDKSLAFPDVDWAEDDGLLAVGSDLSPNRLLLAYESGIFPWYQIGNNIYWFAPPERMVLKPSEFLASKSMVQIAKKNQFTIESVIACCRYHLRPQQQGLGSWITKKITNAYTTLYNLGFAHSVEVYNTQTGNLAGGLYGISLGGCFFGESMFSAESNASKYAFIMLCLHLKEWQFLMLDCQIYSAHLASLGAYLIPRSQYMHQLAQGLQTTTLQGSWTNLYNDNLKHDFKHTKLLFNT